MSTFFVLPHIRVPAVDSKGNLTNEWYLSLLNLISNVPTMEDVSAMLPQMNSDELANLINDINDLRNQVQSMTGGDPAQEAALQDLQTQISALWSETGNPNLAATGITAGTYGDATNVGQFTVGPDGRLTFAQNVPITYPDSAPAVLFYAGF